MKRLREPADFNLAQVQDNPFLSGLPDAALKALDAFKVCSTHQKDSVLFPARQSPVGVFILCEGEVKLSMMTSDAKRLILRIAKPGEILGLSALFSDGSYGVTAEALKPCTTVFVETDRLFRLMELHPEINQKVMEQLCQGYRELCLRLQAICLSVSVRESMGRLLLEWWAERGGTTNPDDKLKLRLTQKQIGEYLGVSREAVVRTFAELKDKGIIALRGSQLKILDTRKLRAFVESVARGRRHGDNSAGKETAASIPFLSVPSSAELADSPALAVSRNGPRQRPIREPKRTARRLVVGRRRKYIVAPSVWPEW